jgi:hypothetical protein
MLIILCPDWRIVWSTRKHPSLYQSEYTVSKCYDTESNEKIESFFHFVSLSVHKPTSSDQRMRVKVAFVQNITRERAAVIYPRKETTLWISKSELFIDAIFVFVRHGGTRRVWGLRFSRVVKNCGRYER